MPHHHHQPIREDVSTIGPTSTDDDDLSSSCHLNSRSLPRLLDAGAEFESLCRAEMSEDNKIQSVVGFPPSCLPLVRLLAGNQCCVDCGYSRSDGLNYASLGYGTILCRHCAHRHKTLSEEDSNVKHLKEDNWDLRSTLSLFEGGNRGLLEFVKQSSQQHPPRRESIDSYSEDVITFNSVYQSEAACAYRDHLARKVDSIFISYIDSRKREDEAKLELLNTVDTSHRDPFQQFTSLEKNGFNHNRRPQSYDEGVIPRRSSGEEFTPSIEMIKQRINNRRKSIQMSSGSDAFDATK